MFSDQGEFRLSGQLNAHQQTCVTQSGTRLDHGDSWKVNACQSCTCTEGQIHCFHQSCPFLRCNKTIMKKGQCCAQCSGKSKTPNCQYVDVLCRNCTFDRKHCALCYEEEVQRHRKRTINRLYNC